MISRHFQKIVFVYFLRIVFIHPCKDNCDTRPSFRTLLRLCRYNPFPLFVFILFILLLQLRFQFWFSKNKNIWELIFQLQKCLSRRLYFAGPFAPLRGRTAFSSWPVRPSYGDFIKLRVGPYEFAFLFPPSNALFLLLLPTSTDHNTILDLRSNLDCLEKVAIRLDQETPGLKNWYYFGRKFDIRTADLDSLKSKRNPSPTKRMIEYIVQAEPHLTVRSLIQKLKRIERLDVVTALKEILLWYVSFK